MNLSNSLANTEATAAAAEFNNGYLRHYSGSVPATADTALSGQTLLSEHRFAATAFGAPNNGALTANAISNVNAAANGAATFYRALKSDGTTVLCQGTSESTLIGLTFNSGQAVAVTAFTHTVTK